jgi:hypothetical protein
MKKVMINDVEVISASGRGIDTSNLKQLKRTPAPIFISNMSYGDIVFKKIDFEEDCKKKIKTKETFYITNPNYEDRKGNFTMDGIFSPKFGANSISSDGHSYSCECGHLTTALNENKVCPKCGYTVLFVTTDLSTYGYINLGKFRVLTYHGINELRRKFKKDGLANIIGYEVQFNKDKDEEYILKCSNRKELSSDGKIVSDEQLTIIDLYDYYKEHEDEFSTPIEQAFTNKIPVVNAIIRPLIRGSGRHKMFKINTYYLKILNALDKLKQFSYDGGVKSSVNEIISLLSDVQVSFMNIVRIQETKMDGKNGDFKAAMSNCDGDYTSRSVLALGVDDLKIDEVILPYDIMLEYWEERLIFILQEMGYNFSAAMDIYLRSKGTITKPMKKALKILLVGDSDPKKIKFSKNSREFRVYKIDRPDYGIESAPYVFTDRNPTIAYGSFQYLRVVGYNIDIRDKTTKVNPANFQVQAADTDGDQLNVIGDPLASDSPQMYSSLMKDTFSPTYMTIDRGTGDVSSKFYPHKDHNLIMTDLYFLSRAINSNDMMMGASDYYGYDTLLAVNNGEGPSANRNNYASIISDLLGEMGPTDDENDPMEMNILAQKKKLLLDEDDY